MLSIEKVKEIVPQSIQEMIATHQMHKFAAAVYGVTDPSLESFSRYIGEKIASRHARWRPVAEGLAALRKLTRE